MLQSKLFLKTKKENPSGEEAKNAKLLIRAHFVDKLMAGVYSMLPLGLRVKRKIEKIIREEMNEIGGQEMLMPALHPRSSWDATGRWEELEGAMYKLQDSSGRDIGLGFTHEEIITDIAKKFIDSYTDLPLLLYQIQTKFRDEERPKSGLLRGREFTMKDLYSFHTSQSSLDDFHKKARKAYQNIFDRVGLGKNTYFTLASGGVFSKYSHEFQTLSDVGEDTIFICENCNVAVNKEIIEENNQCPDCGNEDLKEKSAIEVGNIFKLGTRFSEAVGLTYKDENGETHPPIMGSYGIGIERLMGTVVEIFSDDKGLVWPESIAPFQVHLLSVGEMSGELKKESENAYNELTDNGVEVLFDDRDVSPGEKFADSDLLGIPNRLVVSQKTIDKGKIELKKREEDNERLVELKEVIDNLS